MSIATHSRRSVLGGLAAVSLASQLDFVARAAAQSSAAQSSASRDYRAFVCVFLHGGNDAFNMLVPADAAGHAQYAIVRGDLALERTTLLQVKDKDGRPFGMHPSLGQVHALYAQRRLACVANIGNLLQPTTLEGFHAQNNLPRGLFSHHDQQQAWQRAAPAGPNSGGWGGRLAETLQPTIDQPGPFASNVSLEKAHLFHASNQALPTVLSTIGATRLGSYGGKRPLERVFTEATDSVLNARYEGALKRAFAHARRRAIEESDAIASALRRQQLPFEFPPRNPLAAQLAMVARAIAAGREQGLQRQTFFVSLGGFDHHTRLIKRHAHLMSQFDAALGAFDRALQALELAPGVVTFTASEFARTLTSNGGGADHAWGGHQLIMGDVVQGGQVYGHYPENLATPTGPQDEPLDVGRGRILPTLPADALNAQLCRWFGIEDETIIEHVLPNMRAFHAHGFGPALADVLAS